MDERRLGTRHRTLLAGKIVYGANSFVMDCAIRDLSLGGARLSFGNPLGVPDEFDLHVPARAQLFRAEVRWRRGQQIGVSFRSVAKIPTPTISAAAEVG